MNPNIEAAHKILNTMRRQFGVQHVFRQIDASQFSHLSLKFYSQCEEKLTKMNFQKIMDIEDVTLRSSNPDPRCFLRIMSNPESNISAAIYHACPKFPWPLLMFFMGYPAKVYEFQSRFSDDAVIETSIQSPKISNSYPDKIIKQFYPKKSIEELFELHKKSSDDYLSSHRGVSVVPKDSFEAILEHNKKSFEMTKKHLEDIGWVTKDYMLKMARGNRRQAEAVYDEIQNILNKEKPINDYKPGA